MSDWPDIALQPPGSKDCQFYAMAYLLGLLGVEDWSGQPWSGERVKQARLDSTDSAHPMATFPERVCGIEPAWEAFGLPWEERRDLCYSFAPRFRDWVRSWASDRSPRGCVGYTIVHRVEWMTHVVIVLEADEEGVLLADPARGIVRDAWEDFESYGGQNWPGGKPTHVEAWYRVR